MSTHVSSLPRPTHGSGGAVRWPHLLVLATVLGTYGFELFNFNVSVDEPMFWNFSRLEMLDVWDGQGRWGMGVASLLLPSTNVPVISLALGLAGTSIALWWLGKEVLALSDWEVAVTTSLAVSLPALVFHFSFSINSFGIGLAYLGSVACAHLSFRPGALAKVGAVAAGAFAIGVYEGFAFVLVSIFLAHVWRAPTWRGAVQSVAVVGGSVVVWFVLNVVAKKTSDSSTGYVSEMMNRSGDDGVIGIVQDAVVRMVGIVGERWLYFGYSNPLPALVLGLAFAAGVVAAWRRAGSERLLSILVLAGLAVVVLMPALLTGVVFQRSMVFLPTVFVVVVGIGLPALRGRSAQLRLAGVALVVLAVAGNASLANGAYYSGTIISDSDQDVATDAIAAYRSHPSDVTVPLALVVATRSDEFSRPDTWSGRSSLELGMMGAPGEALRYFQMRGLDVVAPSAEQQERGEQLLESMPAYPADGYLDVVDGILVINLSTVDGR